MITKQILTSTQLVRVEKMWKEYIEMHQQLNKRSRYMSMEDWMGCMDVQITISRILVNEKNLLYTTTNDTVEYADMLILSDLPPIEYAYIFGWWTEYRDDNPIGLGAPMSESPKTFVDIESWFTSQHVQKRTKRQFPHVGKITQESKELPEVTEPLTKSVKYVPFQLCPRCNGEGTILRQTEVSASIVPSQSPCDVCLGSKIIPMFVIDTENE